MIIFCAKPNGLKHPFLTTTTRARASLNNQMILENSKLEITTSKVFENVNE